MTWYLYLTFAGNTWLSTRSKPSNPAWRLVAAGTQDAMETARRLLRGEFEGLA